MKKFFIVLIGIFLLLTASIGPSYALSEDQALAIEKLLDEACSISGGPGISIAIVNNDESIYFSSGYSNSELNLAASKDTLYELASVSKAFTGFTMVFLEEEGVLSMTDSIGKYLPDLQFKYKGEYIDMEELSLSNFLYHTSGLTNEKHFSIIPEGNSEDMLEKTVYAVNNAELEFTPGQKYKYGTINYDVLGLVIEVVTGMSYEEFMDKEIFKPLGLTNTYLYQEIAQSRGEMAQGYRTLFFKTISYHAPVYAGNKPAGYIISNSEDMIRWMRIQMGMIEDIPDIYKRVIEKTHRADRTVLDDFGMYYGAGWSINEDSTLIEHGGVNPNFSSQVSIFPNDQRAISVLTNNSHSNNIDLVDSIIGILDGDFNQSYERSITQLADMVYSILTIVFIILALVFLLLSRKKMNIKKSERKKRIYMGLSFFITIAIVILCLIYPRFVGHTWTSLLVWQPYSLLTALLSLLLLSGSITWFSWKLFK